MAASLRALPAKLADCGVKRINVSLDTLDADKFRTITRWGDLSKVLAGIDAAEAAGLKVKINAVALKGVNENEIPTLMEWAHGRGMDMTLIETMPLGEIDGDRTEQYLPLSLVKARLAEHYTLEASDERTGGPARAMCASPKPAAGSASSRRSATISANPATACASPAPARSICASARKTPPTCARPCVRARRRRIVVRRHRCSDRAQAQRPRLHHRPPAQAPCAGAADVLDRRLNSTRWRRSCISPPRICERRAQSVLKGLRERYGDAGDDADIVVALGGDGFMLQTLHAFLGKGRPIYGMNLGSVGFLMNEYREDDLASASPRRNPRASIPCAWMRRRARARRPRLPSTRFRFCAKPARRRNSGSCSTARRGSTNSSATAFWCPRRRARPPTTSRRMARSCPSMPRCWR